MNEALRRVLLPVQKFVSPTVAMSTLAEILAGQDKTQVDKLHEEKCILVDENDQVTGSASKLDCHLISKGPPLHRAFSVFLFNSRNELLLQRRAASKITFPGYFTNSCCSHPWHNEHEMVEKDALGVKRAAQRRMMFELGVVPEQFPIEDIHYVARILYKAPCSDIFGEHEVDYVLFAKGDVDLNFNDNEISEVEYVSLDNMDAFVKDCANKGIPLTPWFKLILNSHLKTWWKNLDCLKEHYNHKEVLRL